MGDKTEVWQGTLALMVLKTLETMGPQHGYGIARRIEQVSGSQLSVNYGTLHRFRVGHLRQQSPSPFLPADPRRTHAAQTRNQRLAAGHRNPGPLPLA
jgi:hypothetical protein